MFEKDTRLLLLTIALFGGVGGGGGESDLFSAERDVLHFQEDF